MKITARFEGQAREIDLLDLEEIITQREQWRGSHLMRYPIQQPIGVANSATDCYRKMDRNHENDGGNRVQSRQ